ncbi:peptide deformylase [Gehongia tenuis]|uniref:Peptide deformylase n=1 Tax=Gehongia tenuis TaxID=2763655 RepID=A0A926HNM3_9FIRM|nr:peptide deformylase [Gehongia tenuis]
MAIRNIITEGDETLRKISRKQERFDERLWTLLDDMAETMREKDGVGLAAPQVGVLRQVIVIDWEGIIELVNPEIVYEEGQQELPEGCLSIPGLYGIVPRPYRVKVRAQDRNGDPIELEGEGRLATVFCHEIDHLKGRLMRDVMTRELTEDDDWEEEEEE